MLLFVSMLSLGTFKALSFVDKFLILRTASCGWLTRQWLELILGSVKLLITYRHYHGTVDKKEERVHW